MQFKINVKNWGRIFTVPCSVVDEHIKLSSGNSVKVLLYLLCSSTDNFCTEDISKNTGVPIIEVDEAIEYWCDLNVIENLNSLLVQEKIPQSSNIPQSIEAETPANISKKRASVNYSPKDIKELVDNSKDLQFLMDEIQIVLGKGISYTEQRALINMNEYYGYSASTILMVFDYCKKIGKDRVSYVEKVIQDWSDNDITSHEEVETEIIRLLSLHSFENTIKFAFGIDRKLTKKENEFIAKWSEYNFDKEMFTLVYDECINNTSKLSFPYINKILETWHSNKIQTPQQVEQMGVDFKNSKKQKVESFNDEHSYDLHKLFKKSLKTNKITEEVK